jgi:hypothetical protein
MLDLSLTAYVVPCIGSTSTIAIDIAKVVEAESRLADVAIVNIHTAPELLTTFNRNWLDLQRALSLLGYEKNKAENAFKRNKAEALLDCNDVAIRAKGHAKASADLRDALTELEPKVMEAKDRLDELAALIVFLKGKQDAFQKGYESVKKLVGAGQLPLAHIGNGNRPGAFNQSPPVQSQRVNEPEEIDELDLPKGFK